MMTAEQLKSSILQLAMQGKLVEQRPEEGSGRDLLKLIETHFKGTKKLGIDNDELPFEIPVSWAWTKVGNITILYNGRAFKPSDWSDDGLPIVRIQNLNDENAPFNRYNGSFEEVHHLYGGELLFAWSGTPGTSFGAHIWRKQEAVLNQHIFKVEFPESHLDKKYFALALNFQVLSLIRLAHGSAGLQHVTKGTFQNTWIPLPPLAEQKRIVAKIEELMPFVEQYAAASTKLNTLNASFPEMMKKSILQEALQGKLVPQDPHDEPASLLLKKIRDKKQTLIKAKAVPKDKKMEEVLEDEQLFDIPDSWVWTRIGEIFQHNTGKALNGSNKEGTVLPYITTSNLYWNRFELDKLKKMPFTNVEMEKCTAKKGDLLVCEGGDYGRAAIWDYDYDIRIQNHIHKLRAYEAICTEYFYYVFYYLKTTGQIKGKGIAIQGLSSGALHNLVTPLPPVNEQYRIVKKIKEIIHMTDGLTL